MSRTIKLFIGICAVLVLGGVFFLILKARHPEIPPGFSEICYMEEVSHNQICFRTVDDKARYVVPVSGQPTECTSYGIEPLVEMPVLCSYEELCAAWKPENTYHFHFAEEGGSQRLVSIKETSSADECFSYVDDGDLGQLFYNIKKIQGEDTLQIVPVRYMAWDESISKEDLAVSLGVEEGDITFGQELGCVSIVYPQKEKAVTMTEDTRCYILTSAYANRCTGQEMWECFQRDAGSEAVFRFFLDGSRIVCVVCYEIM